MYFSGVLYAEPTHRCGFILSSPLHPTLVNVLCICLQEADSDFTRRRAMAESTRGFEQALRTKHEQQLAQSQRSSHQTMQSKLQALAQGLEL